MFSENDFIKLTRDDVTLIARKSDGYIAIRKYCDQLGKRLENFTRTTHWKDLVEAFNNSVGSNITPMYMLAKGMSKSLYAEYGGSYIHPKLMRFVSAIISVSNSFIIDDMLVEIENMRNQVDIDSEENIEEVEISNPKIVTKENEPDLLLSSKQESDIVPKPSIEAQCAALHNTTFNPAFIGQIGESLTFEFLKRYFPYLENCHTDFHASDFYDPSLNIRFEIKTKTKIHTSDYDKIIYDDQLRRPKLTVLLSTVEKCKSSLRLFPNILIIHISTFEKNPEFWKDFITESEWEREEEIIERHRTNRLEIILEKIETSLAHPDKPTTDIVSVLTGGQSNDEVPSDTGVFNQVPKLQLESSLTSTKESSVKSYVYANEKKFTKGVESHHNKGMYSSYCRRNNLPIISSVSLFRKEMNKYCIMVLPKDRWNTPKHSRPLYISRTLPQAIEILNNFTEFMKKHPTDHNAKKLAIVYNEEEMKLDRLHLSTVSFYTEFRKYKAYDRPDNLDADTEEPDSEESESESESESSST